MKKYLFLFFAGLLGIGITAFRSPEGLTPFSGNWKGTLSQPSGKGMVTSYPFRMKIEQVDNTITGYTRLDIEQTSYFAIMSFKGSVNGGNLDFEENTKIFKQKTTATMRWYIKKGHLKYNPEKRTLSGAWQVDDENDKGSITLTRTNEELSLK